MLAVFWFCRGWWFPLFPIAVAVALIVVFCVAFKRGGFRPPCWRDYSQASDSETAMDILKKRYARGEISKDEFDRMKQDIQ